MRNKQTLPSLSADLEAPSLLKLGACFIYDALVVIALCFVGAGFFVWVFGDATHGIKRVMLQLFLYLSIGLYFIWCWFKSGQTLAMQTWRFKVVNQSGERLSISLAIRRYLLASVSLVLLGLGFLWVLVSRDRLYLHDKLLKTQVIKVE